MLALEEKNFMHSFMQVTLHAKMAMPDIFHCGFSTAGKYIEIIPTLLNLEKRQYLPYCLLD